MFALGGQQVCQLTRRPECVRVSGAELPPLGLEVLLQQRGRSGVVPPGGVEIGQRGQRSAGVHMVVAELRDRENIGQAAWIKSAMHTHTHTHTHARARTPL